jgi:amphi-Trp domain-containing protein
MLKKDLYRLEEDRTLAEIADFLEQVAGDLRKGEINMSTGEQSVSLTLPETVILDIDVDQREKEEVTATTVQIELKWAR